MKIIFLCAVLTISVSSQNMLIDGNNISHQNYTTLNIMGKHVIIPVQPQEFWNDNVAFYNRDWTFYSLGKMGAEFAIGSVLGYTLARGGLTAIKQKDGDFLGFLLRPVLFFVGATAGSTLGVWYTGKLFGDTGNYGDVVMWSFITAGIGALIFPALSKDKNTRLWGTAAMLPVGAVIGFNSNRLSTIF